MRSPSWLPLWLKKELLQTSEDEEKVHCHRKSLQKTGQATSAKAIHWIGARQGKAQDQNLAENEKFSGWEKSIDRQEFQRRRYEKLTSKGGCLKSNVLVVLAALALFLSEKVKEKMKKVVQEHCFGVAAWLPFLDGLRSNLELSHQFVEVQKLCWPLWQSLMPVGGNTPEMKVQR